MRVRRLMTLATGAALGAGAMYLMDPEHGEQRRRAARRRALAQARYGGLRVMRRGRGRAEEMMLAARTGYRRGQDVGE